MMSPELFEVNRNEYTTFVRRVKPEARDIKEYGESDGTLHTELWSKRRNIKLCERVFNPMTEATERYYVWEYPEEDESQEWTPPAHKIVLESPQQVQAVLDAIKKLHEENH